METLDLFINEYLAIQAQEEVLKAKKEDVRKHILENLPDRKYENDSATVSVNETRKFDYLDESEMISRLKALGRGDLVKETVKTTELNKLLKDKPEDVVSKTMFEKNLVKKKLTETLVVKKK